MLAGETGNEDTAKVQTIGARYAHGEITLEQAAEAGCHACASPGGGCQFLGTAATSQVIGEALGLCAAALGARAVGPADLARHGPPLGAGARRTCPSRGITTKHILTEAAFKNALAVFAAFGGSTNLLLHTPAIAFHAGIRRPTIDDWTHFNRQVPRLVDALPNGPVGHPTIRVFLAGGVPEVMLHLRELGLLELDALTVSGENARRGPRLVGEVRTPHAASRTAADARPRRSRTRSSCRPTRRASRGLTSTVTFPRGNLAPDGCVIKSTAIDPSVVDADGVYRKTGPAKVFIRPRRPRSRRSRGTATKRSSRATCWCSAAAGRWAAGWRRRIRSRPR